jgi:hypothetical protein
LVAQGHIPGHVFDRNTVSCKRFSVHQCGLVGNADYGVNQSSAGYLYFYLLPEFAFQQ